MGTWQRTSSPSLRKEFVGFDVNEDKEISRRTSPFTLFPLAADSQFGSGVDTGRDLDLNGVRPADASVAATFFARMGNDTTVAMAVRTGGADREEPLGTSDLTGSSADRAICGWVPGFAPVPPQSFTGDVLWDFNVVSLPKAASRKEMLRS